MREESGWWYLGLDRMPTTRHLRVWRVAPGHLLAVVTQRPRDTGTSVTCAAGMVLAQLAIEHPDERVELIQHYPADGFAPDQFDAASAQPCGVVRWRVIPTERLLARLGRHPLAG